MFTNLLVPIDIGDRERAPRALALAERLRAPGGTIHVLYVVAEVPAFVAAEVPAGLHEAHEAEAREALTKLVEGVAPPVVVDVQTGHASTTILAFAEEIGADCILISSHKPGLADYLLGSTAARVVRHAAATVVVMR